VSKEQTEAKIAAPGEPGYKPVGEVVELAKNSKTGVRVVCDDKNVWKEAGKAKKGE